MVMQKPFVRLLAKTQRRLPPKLLSRHESATAKNQQGFPQCFDGKTSKERRTYPYDPLSLGRGGS